ncbi:hypothetical protein ABBQ38_006916 [Trebouxia sp. C0009 RCD-2024]
MATGLTGKAQLLSVKSQRCRVGQSSSLRIVRCSSQQQRQIKAKAVEAPVRGQGLNESSAEEARSSSPDVQDPAAFTRDVIEREKK